MGFYFNFFFPFCLQDPVHPSESRHFSPYFHVTFYCISTELWCWVSFGPSGWFHLLFLIRNYHYSDLLELFLHFFMCFSVVWRNAWKSTLKWNTKASCGPVSSKWIFKMSTIVFARTPSIIMCLPILNIQHISAYIITKTSILEILWIWLFFTCTPCCHLQIIYSCIPPPGSM